MTLGRAKYLQVIFHSVFCLCKMVFRPCVGRGNSERYCSVEAAGSIPG